MCGYNCYKVNFFQMCKWQLWKSNKLGDGLVAWVRGAKIAKRIVQAWSVWHTSNISYKNSVLATASVAISCVTRFEINLIQYILFLNSWEIFKYVGFAHYGSESATFSWEWYKFCVLDALILSVKYNPDLRMFGHHACSVMAEHKWREQLQLSYK